MNAEIRANTDFTLYDGRRHVLGACMLTKMFNVAQSAEPTVSRKRLMVKSIKFKKKTRFNGKVLLVIGPEACDEIPNAAARLTAMLSDKFVNGWFVPDVNLPVQRQLLSNFEITDIVSHGDLSGTCKIAMQDLHDRLRCVIEAAKRLHLADKVFIDRFTTTPVTELLYLENIKLEQNCETLTASVQVKKLSERLSAGRAITLSKVTIAQQKMPDVNFNLAFSFHCEQ